MNKMKSLGIAATTFGGLLSVTGAVLLGLGTNHIATEQFYLTYNGNDNGYKPKNFLEETTSVIYNISEGELTYALFGIIGSNPSLTSEQQGILTNMETTLETNPFTAYATYGVGSLNFGSIGFLHNKDYAMDGISDPNLKKVVSYVYDNINSRPRYGATFYSYKSAVSSARNVISNIEEYANSSRPGQADALEFFMLLENIVEADDLMISGAVLLPIFSILLVVGIAMLIKNRR